MKRDKMLITKDQYEKKNDKRGTRKQLLFSFVCYEVTG